MPIQTTTVKYSAGKFRATYEFTDGRKITIGPVKADSEASAQSRANILASEAQETMAIYDAEQAVGKSIYTATGEATQKQVYSAYLQKVSISDDVYEIYNILSNIPEIEMTEDILGKWNVLKNRETLINQYKTIKDQL